MHYDNHYRSRIHSDSAHTVHCTSAEHPMFGQQNIRKIAKPFHKEKKIVWNVSLVLSTKQLRFCWTHRITNSEHAAFDIVVSVLSQCSSILSSTRSAHELYVFVPFFKIQDDHVDEWNLRISHNHNHFMRRVAMATEWQRRREKIHWISIAYWLQPILGWMPWHDISELIDRLTLIVPVFFCFVAQMPYHNFDYRRFSDGSNLCCRHVSHFDSIFFVFFSFSFHIAESTGTRFCAAIVRWSFHTTTLCPETECDDRIAQFDRIEIRLHGYSPNGKRRSD